MKFVDEATIRVEAGNGGNGGKGCVSFRREKFVPRGGPDGGNGGDGGNVILHGRSGLNTLADFRHTSLFRAEHGAKGGGSNCTGRSGVDCVIAVPLGTRVEDAASGELIGEVVRDSQQLWVACGGKGGLGNTRFKSSTQRAPRKSTPGTPGEVRDLKLELQVLADIGLLGLPNAGKSTFLRQVTEARPKVADYPFTTLYPHLGVVRIENDRSFVIADIPGLIEGAAEGAGLGIQFLKHLARTRILLHLVDMTPTEPENDLSEQVRAIANELEKFSAELVHRERWLVLNKIDLIPEDERTLCAQALRDSLAWEGPIHAISALSGVGCVQLTRALMCRLEELKQQDQYKEYDILTT